MKYVSKMVFPDMEFSFLWKAPMAPKVKKALLAFLIATSMAFEAERSQDHQYPRHLAQCCMVRASFPRMTAGVEGEGLDDDTSRTSHLVGFSIRALSAAKVSTVWICSCRVAREVVIVLMSSAWANAPAYVSGIDGPRPLLSRHLRSGCNDLALVRAYYVWAMVMAGKNE